MTTTDPSASSNRREYKTTIPASFSLCHLSTTKLIFSFIIIALLLITQEKASATPGTRTQRPSGQPAKSNQNNSSELADKSRDPAAASLYKSRRMATDRDAAAPKAKHKPSPAEARILAGSSQGHSACKSENKKTEPKKFTTVQAVIKEYGKIVRAKLKPLFDSAGLSYPPASLTWIALKEEKKLLVFAPDKAGKNRQILAYPILGASGGMGPKLKEGDKQVPEGFYKICAFKPNVIAHLGLAVNYPNPEDQQHAKKEGRANLGGDILIHGSYWSTGCLAMGNPAIEELFVLAYDSGCKNINLIFAPCDLKTRKLEPSPNQPVWLKDLYKRLADSLSKYPLSST